MIMIFGRIRNVYFTSQETFVKVMDMVFAGQQYVKDLSKVRFWPNNLSLRWIISGHHSQIWYFEVWPGSGTSWQPGHMSVPPLLKSFDRAFWSKFYFYLIHIQQIIELFPTNHSSRCHQQTQIFLHQYFFHQQTHTFRKLDFHLHPQFLWCLSASSCASRQGKGPTQEGKEQPEKWPKLQFEQNLRYLDLQNIVSSAWD